MSDEAKRAADRERIAARRAAMTEEERRAARVANDAAYRDAHREQRRAADLVRTKRKRAEALNASYPPGHLERLGLTP